MCCIRIYCYFDFIALINLVLMHDDNMKFGLLYYYYLLLRKASPNYMTGSRCPHILNRNQCMASFLSPMAFSCSRWMHPNDENKDSTVISCRCDAKSLSPPSPTFLCVHHSILSWHSKFSSHIKGYVISQPNSGQFSVQNVLRMKDTDDLQS